MDILEGQRNMDKMSYLPEGYLSDRQGSTNRAALFGLHKQQFMTEGRNLYCATESVS